MNTTNILISLKTAVFLLVALFLGVSSSQALDLAAVEAEWTPPGGDAPITMWGFIPDPVTCPGAPVAWDVGPLEIVTAGGNLTINLRNCLPGDPVSIIIPGQGLPSGGTAPVWTDNSVGVRVNIAQRVRSFVHEAAPNGGTATYTWNNLKSGTFMYQSGSHPAKQVHMGLYGALTVGTYADTSSEVLLVFSEIDPALHATQSAAKPLDYKPKYYLINGDTFSSADPVPVAQSGIQAKAKKKVLLRMINAGLMSHVPVMQGPHMQIIAEDGNPYPYVKEQYSLHLAAGKTIDAYWEPTKTGSYAMYDRRLSLTSNGTLGGGMLVYLDVDIKAPFPWPMFIPAMTRGGVVQ